MKLNYAILATVLAAAAGPAVVKGRFLKTIFIQPQYDHLGHEITEHYIRPGHHNDGNEGNEGNEGGDDYVYTPSHTPSPVPSDGVMYDHLGHEITEHYIRPGHSNDGNEGNEGNEGDDDDYTPSHTPYATPSDNVMYDALGHEITSHYIGLGHPNDGNEGNEGNEGDDPPHTPSHTPSPVPSDSVMYDHLGHEITEHYVRPGHSNDGNEGNEGNEGGDEYISSPIYDDYTTVEMKSTVTSGKYDVCVSGSYTDFGRVVHKRPEGIRVFADGECELMEYAGGFDGYFSVDAGDGHEDELARAVKLMLREDGAIIGEQAKSNNPRNKIVNDFLLEMRDRSNPTDWDYPQDIAIADGGGRMSNIRKVSAACTDMIHVRQC